MELRKEEEISLYNELARKWQDEHLEKKDWLIDIEDYDVFIFSSYRFCRDWFEKNIKSGMKFLDYGCSHGMHSVLPASLGAEVYGIDLSEESLKIAKRRAQEEKVSDKIKFLKMDCEKLEFPDNYFDLIFDGGAFSSIDINKAYAELSRVLKPDGKVIGIETFGHNPLMNLKRSINKKTGKRTQWAASHIMKMKDLESAKKYFDSIETKFFHLFSMLVFPLRRLPGLKTVFNLLDHFDSILLKIPFLKKYAFKVVFIFSHPVK